jgi:hypothetical protein
VEQWCDQEKRTLKPGDSVFLDGATVHASFNRSQRDCKLLAILSPATPTDNGYEVVELADQEPWKSLA